MIPKFMFHYTSIESIKAILMSHKVRFTRLDLLNDPYEGNFLHPELSHPQDEKRRLIYCSCWNSDENESVSLWHIYTDMRGVRIKVNSSLFSDKMYLEELPSGFTPVCNISPIALPVSILGKASDGIAIKQVYGPQKITYVDTFEDTYTTAVGSTLANKGTDHEFPMYDINLKELGIRKINHWEYEHEWRYRLIPVSEIHGSKMVMNQDSNIISPEYVDVPFIGDIEEILMAPHISNDTERELTQFLCEHNFDIPVKKSCIKYKSKK